MIFKVHTPSNPYYWILYTIRVTEQKFCKWQKEVYLCTDNLNSSVKLKDEDVYSSLMLIL